MHADRKDIDNYITREDPRIGEEEEELTPYLAIRDLIVNLRILRARVMRHPDEEDITPDLDRQIAALELAQWELGEYRKLKAALAVIRNAVS